MTQLSPKDLIDSILGGGDGWDLSSLDLKSNNLDVCPNSVSWITQTKFGGFQPWPRQIEIVTRLFEDYCPYCSSESTVMNMWGKSMEEITSEVTFLQHGVCPQCGRNRNDFRAAGLHHGKHELVGVAGQRCLAGSTPLLKANGVPARLETLAINDLLLDKDGKVCTITKLWMTSQPGYFTLTFEMPDGTKTAIECGDSHIWITTRGEICSAMLKQGDTIPTLTGFAVLVGIEREQRPRIMYDLETSSSTFLHASKLLLHNSGKTFITAVICGYISHRYIVLPGQAADNYELRNTPLLGTFVAGDLAQVAETTWGNFASEISHSNWYKGYFAYLQDEGKRLGAKLYDFKPDSHLWLANKKILLTYATASKRGLRGRTRIIGTIDELGWFDSSRQARVSGPEIFASLSNSLRTIRSAASSQWKKGNFDIPTAYMLNVSSPKAEDDPIMSLEVRSKKDPKSYCFHFATWEINPTISLEDMQSEQDKDPVAFERDFGAQPGISEGAFFSNPEILDAVIDDQRSNAFNYHSEIFTETVKDKDYHYIRAVLEDLQLPKDRPYCLACDAGEANNSYGLGLLGFEDGRVKLHGVVQIQPRALKGGKTAYVHFPSVDRLIIELNKLIPIELVMFDRWNSTNTVQTLRSAGIDALRYSLKYQDFQAFKMDVMSKSISLPGPEVPFRTLMFEMLSPQQTVAQLCRQLRTVRDTGRRVGKPENGDDDIFRCLVLGHWAINYYKKRFDRELYGAVSQRTSSPGSISTINAYSLSQANFRNPANSQTQNPTVFMVQRRR